MLTIRNFAVGAFLATVTAFGQGNYQPLSREAQQAVNLQQQYLNQKSTYERALYNAEQSYRLCMQRIQASPNSNPHSCDHFKNQVIKYQQLLNSLQPPPGVQSGYQPYANPQPMTTNPNALNNQYQQWQNAQQWNQNQQPQQQYGQQQQYAQPGQGYQPYSNPQPMTTNSGALNNQYQQWQNLQQQQQYGQQYGQQQHGQPQIQPYRPYATPQPMTTNTNTLNNQYQQWQNQQQWNQQNQNQNSTRRPRRGY